MKDCVRSKTGFGQLVHKDGSEGPVKKGQEAGQAELIELVSEVSLA